MADQSNPRPIFRVNDNTQGSLHNDVQWIAVEEDTHGLKTLRATFVAQSSAELARDQPVTYLDGGPIDFGKTIDVEIGAGSRARTIFSGVVSAIEVDLAEGKPAMLQLFAEDRLMRLRMTRGCYTYRDLDDAGIASEIARRHEITANVDADGPSYELVQQWNQSDLAFLRDRARLLQAELWFQDGALNFKTRDKREAPTVDPLTFGNDLLEVSIRADLAHQRTDVHVSGFDATARDTIDEVAEKSALARETSGGRSGLTVLDRALGKSLGSLRVREAPHERAEAEAWAKSELLRRARRFVVASGVTNGTPNMQVGSRLDLRRVGRAFTGEGYYATRVCQSWHHERGHRTSFEAERPVLSEAP